VAARLKVFVTSDGFTDYVVAATSRLKALEAWGAHQDLFKTGGAREVDDPGLVAAAVARPGEVLRRTAGADEALKALPKKKPPAKPKAPSKAALRKVETLERRIAELEAGHRAALEAIDEARTDLDRRQAAAERRFDADRRKLEAGLQAARAAL
jgi:hypothetical protein